MKDSYSSHRVLIQGGYIYDHDGDPHQPAVADLLVEGDRIARVAPVISVSSGVETIDARGKLVIPGLVNAHYHSHDVLAKGMFEEMPYDVWALHSNPAAYGSRSHEELRLRTLIGAAEALRNGITTIQDMLTLVPRSEECLDIVLAAYEEIGIRVVLSLQTRDRGALDFASFVSADLPASVRRIFEGDDRLPRDELDFVEHQINRRGPHPTARQNWALGPSGPQRCSPELLEGIADLSRRYKLPVLTHAYETKIQAAAARRLFPKNQGSLLEVLAQAGLMNSRLAIVHGVWLSHQEIARLAEAGACLVHNPVSNLKLKSGIAPVLDLYRASVEIALGCDNCSCGDTQNIFHAMRMFCLLPAVADPMPGPITAAHALRAATLSGAKAVGLDKEVGALKQGMAADFAILDLTEPAFVPFNSAARQIVFGECGGAVETVFVSGRPVVREHKLVNVNLADIAAAAAELMPGFRRDARALAKRNSGFVDAVLHADHAA